ncbi:hypothetical protein ACFC14_18650 [Microbacterium sp. NPDC055988]|uniref:hypothetical protein n=1 Tax=Microbacterium sp. NPDC055988 TaxID=3345671 RepID=UPI0035D682DE
MMLIGLVRPVEVHTITLKGEDISEIRAQLVAQAPAGWELVSALVTMEKAGATRTINGKFHRSDGMEEITAENMDALRAQINDGWQLLSVRQA